MSKETSRGPDFLVIGAARSGTTWLHRVLRQHPALWLAPVKELHYFDKLSRTRTWLDARERRRVKWKNLASINLWHLNYLLGARSDTWYARLFHSAQQQGLIAGEITPGYALLDEETFRRIRRINSEIRLVFVMRDPLDRAWSGVTNAYRKGHLDGLTVKESLAKVRSRSAIAKSRYIDTIRRVETVFSSGQLYCGFFDDLCDRPERFIADLLAFLGAEPGDVSALLLPEAVNSTGKSKPMPLQFARVMAREYLPIVRELCQRFEGPPQKWYARYDALLNGDDENE